MSYAKGDEVTWNTSQGQTHGHVVAKRVTPFEFDGQKFDASHDEPYYVVQSEKTDAKAAHKESALTKRR